MFIKTLDGLALAIAGARLRYRASYACLIAIHYQEQRDFRKRPQAITVRDFVEVTGCWKSEVQLGLKELEHRGIIEVKRGKGRSEATSYSVAPRTRWKEASTSGQVQASTSGLVQQPPNLVPTAESECAVPLKNLPIEKLRRAEGEPLTKTRKRPRAYRGTPAPNDSTTGSAEGDVRPGAERARVRVMAAWEARTEWPDGPDGEPCYAHLDADQWESIRTQLPHDRNFRLRKGEVEMTAIGSRLTLWFRYGYHLKVARDDGPLLRQLIRAELGPDIVVELMDLSERDDLEAVG